MALNSARAENLTNGLAGTPPLLRSPGLDAQAEFAESAGTAQSNGKPPKRSRRFVVGLALWLLLLGLLLAAWAVLPVTLHNSALRQSNPTQPQASMPLASERYWRSLDLSRVAREFSNWKREDLSRLFATVQGQTADPVTRQHLANLAKALQLPGWETSLWNDLFNQPGFVLGVLLSITPLLAALMLVVVPSLRIRRQPLEEILTEETQPQESLEELLADVQVEGLTAPGAEKKEEEKEGEQQPEESQEEVSAGLGDLASLFEEEDTTLSALEAMCKNLPEINIDELLANHREVLRKLQEGIARHAEADSAKPKFRTPVVESGIPMPL